VFGLDGVLVANGGRVFGQGNSSVSECPLMDDRHKCVCVCVRACACARVRVRADEQLNGK